jgi:hypothetical protein
MLSGALLYHLLMLSADENPVAELHKQMVRLLRQAGFQISEEIDCRRVLSQPQGLVSSTGLAPADPQAALASNGLRWSASAF